MKKLITFVFIAVVFSCARAPHAEELLGPGAICVDGEGGTRCIKDNRAYLCVDKNVLGCDRSGMRCAPLGTL